MRLKTNIVDLAPAEGLAAIVKLRPVTFDWKDAKRNKGDGPQVGFIAQEVKPVLPLLVKTKGDIEITLADGSKQSITKALGVDYTKLTVSLVKAVQELTAKISPLDKNLLAQRSEIEALKADNDNEAAQIQSPDRPPRRSRSGAALI